MITALLIVHIAGGSLALIAGSLAAISKKGGKLHRRAGIVFYYALLSSALFSLALSLTGGSSFLFAIGLFTLYLLISGRIWALRIRQARKRRHARLSGGFGLLSAAGMFYLGLFAGSLNIILLVFGGILLTLSVLDLTGGKDPKGNIPRHAGRMGGAFIASVTAFLVVNIDFLPGIVVWLGPTVVGSVFIAWGIGQWGRRNV